MLDITYGDTKNSGIVAELVGSLENRAMTGDLFVGYPILGSVDGRIEVDALLGSGPVDQSQKMTVAARAMAEKKAVGHLS